MHVAEISEKLGKVLEPDQLLSPPRKKRRNIIEDSEDELEATHLPPEKRSTLDRESRTSSTYQSRGSRTSILELSKIQHLAAASVFERPPAPDYHVKEQSAIPTSPVTKPVQRMNTHKQSRRNELEILIATQGSSSSIEECPSRSSRRKARDGLDTRETKQEKISEGDLLADGSGASDRVRDDEERAFATHGDETPKQIVHGPEKPLTSDSCGQLTNNQFSVDAEQGNSPQHVQQSAETVPSVQSDQGNAQVPHLQQVAVYESLKESGGTHTSNSIGEEILQGQAPHIYTGTAESNNLTAKDIGKNPKIDVRITSRKPFQCPVVQCEAIFSFKSEFNVHKISAHKGQMLQLNDNCTFTIFYCVTNGPHATQLNFSWLCEDCYHIFVSAKELERHKFDSVTCKSLVRTNQYLLAVEPCRFTPPLNVDFSKVKPSFSTHTGRDPRATAQKAVIAAQKTIELHNGSQNGLQHHTAEKKQNPSLSEPESHDEFAEVNITRAQKEASASDISSELSELEDKLFDSLLSQGAPPSLEDPDKLSDSDDPNVEVSGQHRTAEVARRQSPHDVAGPSCSDSDPCHPTIPKPASAAISTSTNDREGSVKPASSTSVIYQTESSRPRDEHTAASSQAESQYLTKQCSKLLLAASEAEICNQSMKPTAGAAALVASGDDEDHRSHEVALNLAVSISTKADFTERWMESSEKTAAHGQLAHQGRERPLKDQDAKLLHAAEAEVDDGLATQKHVAIAKLMRLMGAGTFRPAFVEQELTRLKREQEIAFRAGFEQAAQDQLAAIHQNELNRLRASHHAEMKSMLDLVRLEMNRAIDVAASRVSRSLGQQPEVEAALGGTPSTSATIPAKTNDGAKEPRRNPVRGSKPPLLRRKSSTLGCNPASISSHPGQQLGRQLQPHGSGGGQGTAAPPAWPPMPIYGQGPR